MRRTLIYAALAVLAAGAAVYFLFPRPSAPVLLSPKVPVSDGTTPLPPGAKVLPRIEPILDEARTVDLKGDPEILRKLDQLQTSTAPADAVTSHK
ncbi:MAG: hypothetical protein M0011_13950 [Elusimicrobia bacterium]|nr:hypothetical protein [Elusimicrobiota bacterium]